MRAIDEAEGSWYFALVKRLAVSTRGLVLPAGFDVLMASRLFSGGWSL